MDRRSAVTLVTIAVGALGIALILFLLRDAPSTEVASSTTEAPEGTQPPTANPTESSTGPTSTNAESTTTSAAPTTLAPPATLAPGETACTPYGSISSAGLVASPDVVEASGMAASRTQPGVVWAHNDSRDGARVYAIGSTGEDLGGFGIAGASAFDWEDMAAGPGADARTSSLYLGDIGDNFSIRGGLTTVYRVAEPDPITHTGPIEGATVLEFAYPDGTYNAEAMFVDGDSIYIVTKDREEARVYRGNTTPTDSPTETLELIAVLSLGAEVSGADMSWDGATLAFRGYQSVWLWHRAPGATIAETLTTDPCEAPSPDEVQGEAITFLADGAYSTVSEGTNPDLFVVPRDE